MGVQPNAAATVGVTDEIALYGQGMLVRLYGVKLTLGEDLTIPDLWEYMELIDGNPFPYGGLERIAYFDTIGKYCVALFLSIKDQRKWMEMSRAGGKHVKVVPRDVEEGKSLVDFNFLALHAESGRGLYQHYRGSLAIPKLSSIFWTQNQNLATHKRKEWLEENGETAANEKKAKKMFLGHGSLATIIRDEDMPELLRRLSEIDSFSVDFLGLKDEAGDFEGLGRYIKASRYKLKFSPEVKGRSVAERIMSFWNKNRENDKVLAGRVEGKEGKEHVVYDLSDLPPSTYGQFNFDNVADPFDSDDFTNAPLLKQLLRIMKDNKSSFEEELDE